jgi:cation transport ATPase
VTGVHPFNERLLSSAELLSLLASAEQGSEHVLGRAVVQHARELIAAQQTKQQPAATASSPGAADAAAAGAGPETKSESKAGATPVRLWPAEQFEALPGRGLRCTVNGKYIQV